jgi:hypothetical protein
MGFVLLFALVWDGAAAASAPMTLLFDTASGRGSVTVTTTTERLDGFVWLYLPRGKGPARGKASISCETRTAKGAKHPWRMRRFLL